MVKLTKLAGALCMAALANNAYSTMYTIGGSSQPLIVYDDVAMAVGPVTVPGSNFTMFSPIAGGIGKVLVNPDTPSPYKFSGTTEDIVGTFDDSLICFDTSCTSNAMSFSSQTNFSGSPWTAHDIRVFGPGTYTFDTCLNDGSTQCIPGDPTAAATLEVGPGQLGAQVFFDWSGNANIDVFLLWEPNATYTRPTVFAGLSDAETRTYELASRDVDGDGNPGSNMTDGPFGGHNASFSLFLDQPVAIPGKPAMTITQAGNSGASTGTIDPSPGASPVTVDTGIAAASNLAFDWNVTNSPKRADGSDMYPTSAAELITAATGGTDQPTFVFDPTNAAITPGSTLLLSVRVTNTDNGLSNGATVSLSMGCPADSAPAGQDTDGDGTDDATESCNDTDGDGILDYLDPAGLGSNQTSVSLSAGSVATADSGATLLLGSLAASVTDSNGNKGTGIGVSASDIGVTDTSVDQSCVGGCFDFVVSGGSLAGTGTTVNVVVPLSTPVPERAVYKKFTGGAWSDFDASGSDSVNSAASTGGACPPPGDAAYANGLVQGHDCLQITLEDNGPNDSNSAAGTVADPGGIAQGKAPKVFTAPKTRVEGALGCSASTTPVSLSDKADWLLVTLFIAWLGLARQRKRTYL